MMAGPQDLTMRLPLKGKLYLKLDGSETMHELGEITYEADVDVRFVENAIRPTWFDHKAAYVPPRIDASRPKADWKWRDPLGNLIPEGTTHALAQNGNGDPTCVCGYEPKAASQIGAASIIEGHVKSMRES